MNQQDQLNQLREIKNLMELSTRFLSLSGLSGIAAGVFALAGGWFAQFYLNTYFVNQAQQFGFQHAYDTATTVLVAAALVVLLLAIGSGLFFSSKNSKKKNLPFWNNAAKRMLINLSIPLTTGALIAFYAIYAQAPQFIAAITLVFYGLALVNASHNTISDVKFLGIAEIIIGLLALWFPNYGIVLWMIGFGGFHIIYGIFMYRIYDLNNSR